MKKRHIFTVFIICLLIASLTLSALAATTGPTQQAHALVLANAETGDIIYAQNEHQRIHPAATTQIMTALLAVEALDRGDVNIHDLVTTSVAALSDISPATINIGLVAGESMRFEALLHAIMLESAYDAANVVAEHLGGTIENFVQLMNERAYELGAQNTTFTNPHGLAAEHHLSTAYDLFRITQYAVQNPRFVALYSELVRHEPASSRTFISNNRMMDPTAPEFYEGLSGVKADFTSAAGWSFISTATREDVSLLAVVMGVPPGLDGVNHFSETAAIYDWAFENLYFVELLPETAEITRVPVSLGDGVDSVGLRPRDPIVALLLRGTDPQNVQIACTVFSETEDSSLTAPIHQGTVLGEITLSYLGRTYGPIPLVAAENVTLSRGAFMRNELSNTLGSFWVLLVIVVLVLLLILYIVYAVMHSMKKKRRRRERLNRTS